MKTNNAYVVSAARTPIGRAFKGAFRNTRPDDLLAHVIREALAAVPSLDGGSVEDTIIGCAMPEAEQGLNVARTAALLAGLPDRVPGITVNRFCSSGLQAIAMAADRIRLGEADVVIAGGTESMSMIPMTGHKVAMNPSIFDNENVALAYGMGITAEKVAEQWKVSREEQDAFALRSHQRALAAIQDGRQQAGLVPYTVTTHIPGHDGTVQELENVVEVDEGPRPDSSLNALAKLRPAFRSDGSVTAGNSSQMSDSAAALILVSEPMLKKHDLEPLAMFRSFAVVGVPPSVMGIGPVAAVPKALDRAGIRKTDLDWIELNEAFAAQTLAVIRELKLDDEIVNPLGGAIALGHPLGATGAILATKLIHNLRAEGMKYGLVTMCIGGGMGAAGVFESL